MAFKVFYAWQSDRPNNLCRGLIRRALDTAAAKLNDRPEIEDADRQVEIDQDTQGVSGSPSIAETILDKIESCDVFVADLTLIPSEKGNRATPNPNVLIEYGYALHALGDKKIIGVFNSSLGSLDSLPFDLRHRKWPFSYQAGNDGDSDEAKVQRREARDGLATDLTSAIKTVITVSDNVDPAPPIAPAADPSLVENTAFSQAIRSMGNAAAPILPIFETKYPWDDGLVGLREGWPREDIGYEVRLLDGPSISMELKSRNLGTQLTNVETMRIVNEALLPLAGYRSGGWSCVRNRHGGAAFTTHSDDPGSAELASLLTRNGEIYGTDRRHLQVHRYRSEAEKSIVPTRAVEDILINGLANYLKVAREYLGLTPPFDVIAGLDGVTDYRLAVNPAYFDDTKYAGHIFDNSIGDSFNVTSYEQDPFEVLLPLFNKIYDAAGIERPDVRTAGLSQR